jgi:hypothetical protein
MGFSSPFLPKVNNIIANAGEGGQEGHIPSRD